ncbi:MAG TPA: nuclear transport factor 2 family protein [Thermoanaerobaculia bacterium]|jgi:ketosteroid isomerase-like protein|nr:nuclear transport factor 2 family protein [Thermoanaerobaculia bacterium]
MSKLFVLATLLLTCTAFPDSRATINTTLDDWHDAAADADESRYFGAMAPEFIFLGTDATERWDVTSFRAFAHPYFAKGKAWTFVPRDRHVILAPTGDVAWFDEKLDSASYGECRGTGVVRKIGDAWKIAHYNLTIPIPNDLAKSVVDMIRKSSTAPPTPPPPPPSR